MKTASDKTQEPQNSITPRVASEPCDRGTAQLMDNRTSTTDQRKLQDNMKNASTGNETNPIQRKSNKTGLPDNLKSGIENLSGYSMDDVKVHYNSSKPAQLQAHAYAQGTDIHLAPGQQKHLPHEAWHVVQQKQGRVKPTRQLKSKVNINDDAVLEKEADVMGMTASRFSANNSGYLTGVKQFAMSNIVQKQKNGDGDGKKEDENDKDSSKDGTDETVNEEFEVEGFEVGDYLGHTLGGSIPTYYFENGRLTQEHLKPENVGYHPNYVGTHKKRNVKMDICREYGRLRRAVKKAKDEKNEEALKEAQVAKEKLRDQIMRGEHDAPEGEGKLFESTELEDGGILIHPSRGRFITKKEDDRTQEALKALKDAKLAENEKET